MDAVIIRPGALGDTLMALPSLVDVEGEAALAFVGRQPGLRFIQPHVNRISDLDGAPWHRLFLEHPEKGPLPLHHAQCVVAFFGDPDGRIRTNLIACYPNTPVYVFPFLPPGSQREHVARHIAKSLQSAGIPVDPQRAVTRAITSALIEAGKTGSLQKNLVFHPGSGDPKKNYPPDWWLEVLEQFCGKGLFGDLQPLVLLGPAEEPMAPLFRERLASTPCRVQFCTETPLLYRILQEAALYLGHDSGVTHLAAMMGVPTLALFKGTNADQWRPLGPHVTVVAKRGSVWGLGDEVLREAAALLQSGRC